MKGTHTGCVEKVTLPRLLRTVMNERGLNQTEAADAIGTSQVNVSRWLKGTFPKPDSYEGLCKFLNVNLDQLGALIIRTERVKWERQQW